MVGAAAQAVNKGRCRPGGKKGAVLRGHDGAELAAQDAAAVVTPDRKGHGGDGHQGGGEQRCGLEPAIQGEADQLHGVAEGVQPGDLGQHGIGVASRHSG